MHSRAQVQSSPVPSQDAGKPHQANQVPIEKEQKAGQQPVFRLIVTLLGSSGKQSHFTS